MKESMGNYPIRKQNSQYPRKQNNHVQRKTSTQRKHPAKQNTPQMQIPKIFTENLVNTTTFGKNAREISGYVHREVIIKDRHGNQKIMREKQFFNAGQNLGQIRIKDR